VEGREAELKTIFATAPDAIVILDEKFRVIDANDAARAMFGLTADELKMFPLARLISDLPADITAARAVAALAHRKDGREFPVDVSFGSALVDERVVYIGSVRDLAERREMEEKLTERDQRLERTLRVAAAAEMASALAHELNQPLMAASTYVQALDLLLARRGGAADAELGDTMRKTVAEVERAARIVRRLREFYRRDSGKAEAVGLQPLIDTALAPLMSHIERHGVDVSIAVAPGVPRLIVDRIQIEMVLHNLLRNALDSIIESQPDVRRIAVDAHVGDAVFVTIGVEDSGGGVKPCIVEQLFKSFVTSKSEGMGLGLAISRSIAERHGGRLWLERNGPGTRFMLTLPTEQ
jgi:two-component system, LuxR family, sensor kinase FixL